MPLKIAQTLRLILRSLQPSVASVCWCLLLGIGATLLHIATVSIQYGTLLPNVLDGQFATFYTNTIVGPLTSFLHGTVYATISQIFLWSLFGIVFYEACSALYDAFKNWRHSAHIQSFTKSQQEIQHVFRQNLLLRGMWRLCISVLFLYVLLLVHPVYGRLSKADSRLVHGDLQVSIILPVFSEWLFWAFVLQMLVIFGRLYSFRVRLGDQKI